MESILVLTHADDSGSALTKASLEAVTAGKGLAASLNASLTIGIVAVDALRAATALASAGARLLAVFGEAFAQPRYASDAVACEALCRAANATIVLAPGSSRFTRVAAGVAHRLGGFIDTHITAIAQQAPGAPGPSLLGTGECRLEASRWFYRQRIEATLTRDTRPWFLLLDSGTNAPFFGELGSVEVEQIQVQLPTLRTTVSGLRAPTQTAQTIRPEAKLLLVAGAGWTKKQLDGQTHPTEAGDLILNFLRLTNASLGSSKSLVDQGSDNQPVLPFLTHLNQIGQTGATPRHLKGLSTCCHGEEPHVVGWRFIAERRAISLDPNCGWTRGKADVVYIADAFQIIAKLNALLEATKP
jgi:electron transfer flavoprotein alpha subunit